MDDVTLSEVVQREIIDLHVAFEQWFRGVGPANLDRVELALDPDFTLIPPNGTVILRQQLLRDLKNARGSREIDIRIEHSGIAWYSGDAVLATYQEVQHHAQHTTRRRCSALLSLSDRAPNGVAWHHVHETWIDPPPP